MSSILGRKPKSYATASTKVKNETPYVAEAIQNIRTIFVDPTNKYELYEVLAKKDPEIYGAIDTKATFVSKIIAGFAVETGKDKTPAEIALLKELEKFHNFMRRYYYDIAFKVIRDGNACYLITTTSKGVTDLTNLPMQALTCVENEAQIMTASSAGGGTVDPATQPMKPGIYILSEGTDLEQRFPVGKVAAFDLGRLEKVVDIRGRITYNVWNESPVESLRAKMLWKESVIINDMLWRERNVPREHHKLPAAQFDPNNFPGRTPAERFAAAKRAAEETVLAYAKGVMSTDDNRYIRPDQGYVSLDNVVIEVVEPKTAHTDPNELMEQIDKSIYTVMVPESAVAGRAKVSYATETAVMLYTTLKSERIAEAISLKAIDLAIKHLRLVPDAKWTEDDYGKIVPKLNKLLERHSLVRDSAILLESGSFTPTEVRGLMGFDELSDADKEEIKEYREFLASVSGRRHIASQTEVSTTSKRSSKGAPTPITPQSEEEQALT